MESRNTSRRQPNRRWNWGLYDIQVFVSAVNRRRSIESTLIDQLVEGSVSISSNIIPVYFGHRTVRVDQVFSDLAVEEGYGPYIRLRGATRQRVPAGITAVRVQRRCKNIHC